MRRSPTWAAGLFGLFASTACSCMQDPTQLVVVVHSDLAVTEELDAVTVRVEGPVRDVGRGPIAVQAGQLPLSFGVAPANGKASSQVTVMVGALHGDDEVIDTRAVTSFIEHRRLRLDLWLARRCVEEASTCDPSETCGRGGCQEPEIDPGDLPEYSDSDVDADAGGDADGDGDSDVCVEDPRPTPGGGCPVECTGGCADEDRTCRFLCDSEEECAGLQVMCPEGHACELLCAATRACGDATLFCPQRLGCTASCSGLVACEGFRVDCQDGPCGISCDASDQTCDSALVTCGPGRCWATCGGVSEPTLSCGGACACTGCP